MQHTFEQIVNMRGLEDGTKVTIRMINGSFSGKIVGVSGDGLIPQYIVECTDGTFPNETYPHKFLSLPSSEIL
jgi:hypothetical protein